MKTLFEKVTDPAYYQEKHYLCDGYTENYVNNMSKFEFLKEISEYIEEVKQLNKLD